MKKLNQQKLNLAHVKMEIMYIVFFFFFFSLLIFLKLLFLTASKAYNLLQYFKTLVP